MDSVPTINKIITVPQYADNNHMVGTLMEPFLTSLLYDKGHAPGTINKYRANFKIFLTDMGDREITALALQDFTSWKQIMKERNLSPAATANLLYTLRGLLHFCQDQLELPVVDFRKIQIPKSPQRLPEVLTPEEQQRFFDAIQEDIDTKKDWHAIRFNAFVRVLRSTGARISEAMSLNTTDIGQGAQEVKVMGKGAKERILYLTEDACMAISMYLKTRHDSHPALFISQGNNPQRWSRSSAQDYFPHYAKKAGINKHVTAHTFRRIFCTTLHRNGADLLTIKELAGHADIKTTMQYYIATDKTHLKNQHQKFLRF